MAEDIRTAGRRGLLHPGCFRGKDEGEGAATTQPVARGAERAMVAFGNGFTDGQTQTESAKLSRDAAVGLLKRIKDAFKVFRLNARAGVLDFNG